MKQSLVATKKKKWKKEEVEGFIMLVEVRGMQKRSSTGGVDN